MKLPMSEYRAKFKVGDIISEYKIYKKENIPTLYLVLKIVDNRLYQLLIISSPHKIDIKFTTHYNICRIDELPSLKEVRYEEANPCLRC